MQELIPLTQEQREEAVSELKGQNFCLFEAPAIPKEFVEDLVKAVEEAGYVSLVTAQDTRGSKKQLSDNFACVEIWAESMEKRTRAVVWSNVNTQYLKIRGAKDDDDYIPYGNRDLPRRTPNSTNGK